MADEERSPEEKRNQILINIVLAFAYIIVCILTTLFAPTAHRRILEFEVGRTVGTLIFTLLLPGLLLFVKELRKFRTFILIGLGLAAANLFVGTAVQTLLSQGSLEVSLPGEYREGRVIRNSKFGEVEVFSKVAGDGRYIFLLQEYSFRKRPFQKIYLEDMADWQREEILGKSQEDLIYQEDADDILGTESLELAIRVDSEKCFKSRFYILSGKLYQVSYLGPISESESPKTRAFFDSVRIRRKFLPF
ncbi:hypothetical protein EHQ61_13705 [Leptospira wolffii]|uniref:hypothetical protein n=1 Tax=Leptospira wolffii TaxID=409998 RepID=UPI00108262ED|nr:hypothetical protein [Leptospira wolffii]TGL49492.1 hypothetical protein EHQ61_13705 [Leptospira wolffii]